MKKWIVLFLCGLLAACSPTAQRSTANPAATAAVLPPSTETAPVTPTASPATYTPSPTVTLTPAPSLTLTATVYHTPSTAEVWATQKAAYAQTATAEPLPPLDWRVEVLQDNHLVAEQDGVYPVKKTHFTLRVVLPRRLFDPLPFDKMLLNVSDQDTNFRRIQPGSIDIQTAIWKDGVVNCAPFDPDCFVLAGMAQADHSTYTLAIDQRFNWASHLMSYDDPKHTRWSKVLFSDTEAILEQDVYVIDLYRPDGSEQIIQLKYYSGEKLYLVFFMKYRAGPVVSPDELKKVILKLE